MQPNKAYTIETAGRVPTQAELPDRVIIFNLEDGLYYWRKPSTGAIAVSAALPDLSNFASKTYVADQLTATVGPAVSAAISALVGGAPATLDTLKEIADSFGDDPLFMSKVLRLDTIPTLTTAQVAVLVSTLGQLSKWELIQGVSGTFTPDFGNGNGVNKSVWINGATTINTALNMLPGVSYIVRIRQDASGNRALTFGPSFDFGAAGAPRISTGALLFDAFSFTYQGQNTDGSLAIMAIQIGSGFKGPR